MKRLRGTKRNTIPFLVCSGGTTSRAAADNHWTIDLRKNYRNISFNSSKNEVEIEAGVTMSDLTTLLTKYRRSFPIGLSGITGMGYIITGGISPLSRKRGLAIDQLLEINGYWGTGEKFELSRPDSSKESNLEWKSLCGAAAFLGIVTKVKLKTQPLKPLLIWSANLSSRNLSECIYQAEDWPNSISFQWSWGENIFAYAIAEIENNAHEKVLLDLLETLPFSTNRRIKKIYSMRNLPNSSQIKNPSKNIKHSEVLGLLGPAWQRNSFKVINKINNLINTRPDNSCYIAAQQLGGEVNNFNNIETSFIHRNAIWKPWINGAWEAGDEKARERSLVWMQECWSDLEFICPGVHLAQIHPHLSWHKKEISSAFRDWLPKLKHLKSIYDPDNIMPSL